MKRRQFVVSTAAALTSLASYRAKAAVPCPPPAIRVDALPEAEAVCEDLPSWVPQPGQWAAVGLNTLIDVQGPAPASGSSFSSNNGFLNIWSGGAYAPAYGGRYGSIIYGPNGGHDSYDGSDVYAYDIETRLCSLVKATYNPTSNGVDSNGRFPDGSPSPPHSYDGHLVIPVGPMGTLVVPDTYDDLDSTSRANTVFFLDLATKQWSSRSTLMPGGVHQACAFDERRQSGWWYGVYGGGPLTRYDGSTSDAYPSVTRPFNADTVGAIDSTRDQFVIYWHGNGSIAAIDLDDPENPSLVSTPNNPPGNYPAFEYVREIDRFIAWGSGRAVYELDPGDPSAGWQSQGEAGAVTPPSPSNGCFSKYVYVSAVRCLIGVSRTDAVAYAYRPIGT
jgi:hypothetical protein